MAGGVRGIDPVGQSQLTRDELEKAEADPAYRMKLSAQKTIVVSKSKKAPRYTPVSKRQNRPDAIAWIVRNHPEISDAQISRLLGTTKTTIMAIREGTHWNASNLQPQDPVGFGLCTQIDLDLAVKKAAAKQAKLNKAMGIEEEGPSLKPTEETIIKPEPVKEKKIDASSVFANFTGGDSD